MTNRSLILVRSALHTSRSFNGHRSLGQPSLTISYNWKKVMTPCWISQVRDGRRIDPVVGLRASSLMQPRTSRLIVLFVGFVCACHQDWTWAFQLPGPCRAHSMWIAAVYCGGFLAVLALGLSPAEGFVAAPRLSPATSRRQSSHPEGEHKACMKALIDSFQGL